MDVYDEMRAMAQPKWVLPDGKKAKVGVYTYTEIEVGSEVELEERLRDMPAPATSYDAEVRAFHLTHVGSRAEILGECLRRFSMKCMVRDTAKAE